MKRHFISPVLRAMAFIAIDALLVMLILQQLSLVG
jgi:hypothetical protein